MAWTEDIYPQFSPYEPHAFQILPAPQQPPTILQQLPGTVMPPGSAASIRPGGHVKEGGHHVLKRIKDCPDCYHCKDLVEMMMIQNAQMHQIIMNNMTMSALSSSGYRSPPSGHVVRSDPVIPQESEADMEIYHHYYQPAPYLSYPACLMTQIMPVYQDPNKPPSSPPHKDRPAVPPPPAPSSNTARIAGADVTPTAGQESETEAARRK